MDLFGRRGAEDLTEGKLWKKMLVFLLPIFVGSIIQQAYGIADAIIVGRFVGKQALGAVNSMTNLMRLFLNLFEGMSAGACIIIGQAWGAKDTERLSDTVHTAAAFSLAAGLCLTAVCIPLTPFFMQIMRIPADMKALSGAYTRIYFAGMVASLSYNMAAGILRAVGDSRRPFLFLLVACAANILLDLLFVGVFSWGVAGAAFATVLSQCISAVLALGTLYRTKDAYRLVLRQLRIRAEVLKNIVRIGLPIGIQGALFSISNITVQSTVNSYGTDVIAAWGIHGKVDAVIWTLMEAFGITRRPSRRRISVQGGLTG